MKKPPTQSASPVGASDPKSAITIATGQVSESDDAVVGQQLTAQYKRAVSGMREVLIFGAMLMQVESCVQRGQNSASRGPTAKGTGLKGWLERFAPEISRPTAYRFLGITKAIAGDYQAIVGSQIAGRYDLPTLALADPATLPERVRAKQLELFDYVAGTSQRSWLDQFKGDPYANNGGHRDRPNGTKRRTAAEKEYDDKTGLALDWYRVGFPALRLLNEEPGQTWENLPDVHLANVADLLKLVTKRVDEACRARRIVPSKIRDWDKTENEK